MTSVDVTKYVAVPEGISPPRTAVMLILALLTEEKSQEIVQGLETYYTQSWYPRLGKTQANIVFWFRAICAIRRNRFLLRWVPIPSLIAMIPIGQHHLYDIVWTYLSGMFG